nr:hypothetical protein [Paenibacillus sp. 7523-1]
MERKTIIVRQGKGQKGWRALLSNLAWGMVQKHIAEYLTQLLAISEAIF